MEALAPLPTATALLGAAVLTAATKFLHRRVADVLSILFSATILSFCLALLLRALEAPFVYWFGGWQPRDGIALGISFSIDPVGPGWRRSPLCS